VHVSHNTKMRMLKMMPLHPSTYIKGKLFMQVYASRKDNCPRNIYSYTNSYMNTGMHRLTSDKKKKEKKRKEKTTPFGVNLMRSQVLYRAAQVQQVTTLPCNKPQVQSLSSHSANICKLCFFAILDCLRSDSLQHRLPPVFGFFIFLV